MKAVRLIIQMPPVSLLPKQNSSKCNLHSQNAELMPRRRLRLSSYSDEDDDNDIHLQESAAEQRPSVANPSNLIPEPVPISDDEFINVSDDLDIPPPPEPESEHNSYESHPARPLSSDEGSGCPVSDFLSRMGLRLKREWLESCIRGLELDVATMAKLCFEQFLFSDMNYCGGGVLPPNVDSMHLVDLSGPFVLQVDEIVNISCPLRDRYQEASPGSKRCLKLSMTDGIQRVFGMEYRPIKDLKVLAPAGLKIVICNVHVRRGLLLLVPEAIEVLGGTVQELDAARQCLVNEVNKPPRGKRSRTGVVPPLATRASLAAWPQVSQSTDSSVNNQGHMGSSVSASRHGNGFVNIPGQSNNTIDGPGHTDFAVNVTGNISSSAVQPADLQQTDNQGSCDVALHTVTNQWTREESTISMSAEKSAANRLSSVAFEVEEMRIDTPVSGENSGPNDLSNGLPAHGDIGMVEEHGQPLILSGEKAIPFTYLASLSAQWAAVRENTSSVQGKVKCFLTGVKAFQYKQRTRYELQVYVDDGSLISDILIDHNLVQKGIGHSPEDVTAALSSSNKENARDMKETLKNFQMFLVNFEGVMLIEMNETSSVPIALEMNQGCTASDAWLLIRRLKSLAPVQTPQNPTVNRVDISP
ncbi:hypothetical protein K2173_027675 [Erythroxylum novogranatense]|uniref:RecQ-mediated genome instability protein 1 n=1 Tax=Erythroxylum novogranatense TaxID=1862640 RepID=A0AAV8U008_9ROSI|nr:hypothetical protein K2173_027675 [Erythroxylum novogranatense]